LATEDRQWLSSRRPFYTLHAPALFFQRAMVVETEWLMTKRSGRKKVAVHAECPCFMAQRSSELAPDFEEPPRTERASSDHDDRWRSIAPRSRRRFIWRNLPQPIAGDSFNPVWSEPVAKPSLPEVAQRCVIRPSEDVHVPDQLGFSQPTTPTSATSLSRLRCSTPPQRLDRWPDAPREGQVRAMRQPQEDGRSKNDGQLIKKPT
jgi:hypothetical protein